MDWVSHRAVLPSAEGVAPTEEAPALLSEVRLKHENKAPGFAHKYTCLTEIMWVASYNFLFLFRLPSPTACRADSQGKSGM